MKVLHVSEFIEIVNGVLRETLGAELFAVEGEVSGYRVSQGQWVSFDLKDEKALVNIFMPLWNLNVPIEDGARVRVFGLPRVYPKYGKFSLSAERIELAGEGALKKALALLRQKLEKEGMFDVSRKRMLPRFPSRIALVASRESAAYGDFIRVVQERWGGLEIDVYHVLVQGERAAKDIVTAIEQAQSEPYDVLVMTRGGGSLEELMAFNDERVVRAIHASRIPTLVAIGHERDITFAEEAADVRGSTPTDCARRLVPDRRDALYELATLTAAIDTSFIAHIEDGHLAIDRAMHAPEAWLTERRMALEALTAASSSAVATWVKRLGEELSSNVRLLASLDPNAVVKRGYAILKGADGKSLTSVKQLSVGANVRISLKDGDAGATVTRLGEQTLQPKLL
ncbi:MAG: exodeoxyribonuclease VII large subunit [Patescibacteria group bacterium]